MENSQFRSIFLDSCYLLKNKKYLVDVKQDLKGSKFFKRYATAVAMATRTFQDGRNFGFKVI